MFVFASRASLFFSFFMGICMYVHVQQQKQKQQKQLKKLES